ncbi:demethylmenaquinone methyltransferase-like [Haliotis rubra]|uniref:demethylmenaquinone methyltransferase-like n=1 Tax=Haliotis rubra TaxID=36100 RepID=UPI001EE5B057|nr:demethylmenaquinone methyltransferase-like [Haliotis rubra]XP_046581016.1 demethylmenaquinone methyltransferase-like [Haliotis rubra]
MAGRHTDARFEYGSRKKLTPQDIADMFNDYAEDYEQEYLNIGLRSHIVVGDFMAKTVPEEDRSKVKVLDVGAGTGLLGNELKNLGFTHIDALDPAEKMLDVSRRRNIYQRLICAFMNKNRNDDIDTDYYDYIVASAAFNEGLVPSEAFQEMIRIVKPGGRITFTVPTKFINNSDDLRNRLRPLIDQMAREGVWEVTSVALEDGELSYTHGPGTMFSLKVLVSEKIF